MVFDAETGETIIVPFSQDDLDLVEKIEIQKVIDIENNLFPQPEDTSLKESAVNKLKALGLTEEEAKALVGL